MDDYQAIAHTYATIVSTLQAGKIKQAEEQLSSAAAAMAIVSANMDDIMAYRDKVDLSPDFAQTQQEVQNVHRRVVECQYSTESLLRAFATLKEQCQQEAARFSLGSIDEPLW